MRRTTPPRERRGGTCPSARPRGSYENTNPSSLGSTGLLFSPATSYKPLLFADDCFLIAIFQLLRHLLEDATLVVRQAIQSLLRNLVEHDIELLIGSLRN
jgi:hypothetical protein